jgi:pimeloyl-ACP methyl ester carboxylesterase
MLDLVEIPEPSTVRTADGRTVGYYAFGDPHGTPVVALHGTPACGAGYAWADERARVRGIRLLAPDRPGVGESDPWRLGRVPEVADYASALAMFADALELESFSLLGYSGGGPYALRGAHALSGRVHATAIVSGAGQVGEWASIDEFETSDQVLTRLAERVPVVARATLALAAYGARFAPKTSARVAQMEMIAADRAVMAEFPTARSALAVFTQSCRPGARGVVDDYAILGRPWGFAIEEIAAPVHCWHATADKVVPLHHTQELVRRIPGAQLTQWPDEGHLAIVGRIGEVFDALLPHAPGARGAGVQRDDDE